MNNYQPKGQILLFMILIMSVALTVGLSIATQAITNIKTTSEEKSSEQAFSAAEAGVERALQNNGAPGVLPTGALPNNASYQTTITNVTGTQFLLNSGSTVIKDNSVDVWLSTYPGYKNPRTGNVTIYWGSSSDTCTTSANTNTMAALEIVIISGTTNNPQITHAAFDPCQVRSTNNHFTYTNSGGATISGKSFANKATLVVNSGLLVRIIPLYASAVVGVTGCDGANANCSALPVQGTVISSVGISDTAQRKIIRMQSNPRVPVEIFSYTLFSPK